MKTFEVYVPGREEPLEVEADRFKETDLWLFFFIEGVEQKVASFLHWDAVIEVGEFDPEEREAELEVARKRREESVEKFRALFELKPFN